MKTLKISFLVIAVMAICSLQFTGCTKEDDLGLDSNVLMTSNEYSAPNEYEFVNPEWIVIEKNYVDEYGNVGVWYQDANNPDVNMIEFASMSKAKECPQATGTYIDKSFRGVVNIVCDPETAKDCWVGTVEYQGKTVRAIFRCPK
ncbi:hypothetical protein LJC11_03965 [Bacteroidales bacterium OttesenSCG-928-I21]|nr:hypothetical protein [Bacteroidales bacterium OttesenSCG-928-I21]